jgi:hypothetical protein
VGQAIVFRRLPFILEKPADLRRLLFLLIFLFDRFMHVVVVSHHPGQQEKGDQQRTIQQRFPRNGPIVPRHIRRNRDHQSRHREADPQFPRPEHQVEMILAADLAPGRKERLNRNQKLDDQQRAEKAVVHVQEGKYL